MLIIHAIRTGLPYKLFNKIKDITPFTEDDWESWKKLTMSTNIQIVGDDLFATNIKRLKRGIEEKSANAILIKLNQIGTVSETLDAINLAKKNNFETNNTVIDFYINNRIMLQTIASFTVIN